MTTTAKTIGQDMAASNYPKRIDFKLAPFMASDDRIASWQILNTVIPIIAVAIAMSAVTTSFNAITVDNHMSTNETAIIMASGLAGNSVLKSLSAASKFAGALDDVCLELALQMVSDGEGATKGLEVVVRGARSINDARTAGLAVANSPLVKCALFGGDPNWGRIVSAVGACGIACKQERIDCKIGSQYVLRKGSPITANQRTLKKTMSAKVVTINVDLHMGKAGFRCYGCDLTPEYVRINADYHT